MKTAEEILKSKMNPSIAILNNPDYTFNKVIEAMEEYANQAFNAGRERLPHPDYDHIYDDFEDYKKAFHGEADNEITRLHWW